MTTPAPHPQPHAIAQRPIADFLEALAAKTPTPGGGAAVGILAATAAATAAMVLSYSIHKKSLAQHRPALEAHDQALRRLRDLSLTLAAEDAEAYERLNTLQRLPDTDPAKAELPTAARAAANVPLAALAAACDLLRHLAALPGITNPHLRSDLAVAAIAAEAAARAADWNVRINCPALPGPEAAELTQQADQLLATAKTLGTQTEAACQEPRA